MAADEDLANGLATAADAALDEQEPDVDPAQLPLFPAGRLDDLAPDPAGRRTQYEAPRGRGRPPGAKNRSTTHWMAYLHARYPSPLVTLAEIRCRPTEQLAEELRCDRADAAALQVRCADIEAPYWHSKQPIGVRVQDERPSLVLVDPAAWLAQWEQDHPEGDTLDLSAVRVRGEALVARPEAGERRALAALQSREQEANNTGTAGDDGARMAQGDANVLEDNDFDGIDTPMLNDDEGLDDGADD